MSRRLARPASVAPRLAVDVVHEAGDWAALGLDRDAIDVCTSNIENALMRTPEARVSSDIQAVVAFADEAMVRTLNKTYRGQDKPTNVLSFPSGDATRLGDVVLALETVAREAADLGIPPAHHVQHLILHGLLHLLGFDHETDADAAEMEKLETRILAELGIADPYAGDG